MKTPASDCRKPFDEELLSGYLDHALSQAQSQKIRIHLEDCGECRVLHDELAMMRQAALNTPFDVPAEDAWPELPKTAPSRFSFSVGWILLTAWLVVTGGWTLVRFVQNAEDPFQIFLYLGLPGALALLFFSALLDRLRDLKTDRYRGVHR